MDLTPLEWNGDTPASPNPSEVNLTFEQQDVIRKIVTGIRSKSLLEQTLGGYAGTGKTTIVSYLLKVLRNYAVCAFTGKAANVLRRKGVFATTIHSLIYRPVFDAGGVHWELNPDLDCDGIIVDEASMVALDIYRDLSSFGKPILFVGDHGQLEPVGSDFNLMSDPMYTLEHIHRNAGDIAKFAEWLRFGKRTRDFRGKEGTVRLLRQWDMTPKLMTSVDQIICAFNKTRVETNNKVRMALGFSGGVQVGEKVMCLRNNKQLGIFNGMQGIVRGVRQDRHRHFLDLETYGDNIIEGIQFDPKQFGQEKAPQGFGRDDPNPFDWAYCITAHKSQGDEWDNVMIMEQICSKWEHKRWTYTCASRAKKMVHWLEA